MLLCNKRKIADKSTIHYNSAVSKQYWENFKITDHNPANIRLDEDVFRLRLQKTSSRRFHQDEYIRLVHTSSEDVLKTSWSRPIYSSWLYVFKTSSKRLQDVLKTFSKRLQDIFKTSSGHLQDVFKMFWRRLQDVFKTYH